MESFKENINVKDLNTEVKKLTKEQEEYVSGVFDTNRNTAESFVRKHWKRESCEVNGSRVELYGIVHVPKTLDVFKKELEKAIENSSAVVLEYAPNASGFYSEENLNDWAEIFKSVLDEKEIKISKEEIKKSISNTNTAAFYGEIEKIIAEKGKNLFVIDPDNLGDMKSSSELVEFDKNKEIASLVVSAGGITGYIALELLQKFRNNITRRSFLKNLIGFIGFANLFPLISSMSDRTMRFAGVETRDVPVAGGMMGALAFNLFDYREVSVSHGINEITKEGKREKPLVVIYGAGHVESIKHYLESPKEREVKNISYAPYKSVVSPKIREYKFEEGNWIKLKELEL